MIRRRTPDLPDDPRLALAEVRDPLRRLRTTSVVGWLHEHPDVADGLVALALFGVAATSSLVDTRQNLDHREPDPLLFVLLAMLTLPVAVRRRVPRLALLVTMLAVPPYLALNYVDNGATLGTLVCLYTVASLCPRRDALVALAWSMVIVVPILVAGVVVEQEQLPVPVLIGNIAIYVTAWVLGNAVRNRRELVASLEQRAADLERERALEAQRAVEEERARIARELHDVVAHGLSVMVVQAGGARRIVATDPDRAVEALGVIEATGRESMAEMRRLLGVLRDGGGTDGPELAPQPGLDALDPLLARWNDAGLPVGRTVEGTPVPLPAGEDVAAYRIVQEALTNVSKHAGTARAEVTLAYLPDHLVITVADDGRGAAAPSDGRGQGLAGMRERAAVYGGSVEAGPRTGGGWQVRAELPLGPPADAAGPAGPTDAHADVRADVAATAHEGTP